MITSYRPKRERQIEKQLEDRNAMSNKPLQTCRVCGITGNGVIELPYYDPIFKRDSTTYMCSDIDSCLNRCLPDYYRKRE